MEEWNPFLILWLWQPEGSWDSKMREKVPGPFVHNFFPQVMENKQQSALTFSPQIEELGQGDRRIHALIVIEHHLKLFLHVVIGLSCVYTGPVTQAGTLNVKWPFGDKDFTAHTQFPWSHYALCSSPWGHWQRHSVHLLEDWTLQKRW